MLPGSFVVIAILLRLASGASYFNAIWRGKAQPSLVSWLSWSVTALIAFAVQLIQGAGPEAFVTLAIGLSPVAVCAVAIYKRAYVTTLSRTDKRCITLTVIGILLWLASKDPLTALFMSILADIFSNIPTFLKGCRAPHTEHASTYAISVVSMVITLLTITDWQLTNWLFPAYILIVNAVNVLAITTLSKLRWPAKTPAEPSRLSYERPN